MNRATVLSIPQIEGATSPGARGKHNDDYAESFRARASQNDREIVVLALADGVTSTGSGDQASRIAVETIKKSLRLDNNKQPLRQRLQNAVIQANEEIWRQAQANPEQRNMSTTLVLAAVDGDQLRVVHVGDSRAYLVRDGAIHRLTRDHTWVQEALDVGRLDEKSAKQHPNRHVIQRYLGISQQVRLDHEIVFPGTYHMRPHERKRVESLTLQAGDVILVCSDGLTESVSDDEIKEEVLRCSDRPKQVAEALIELALERNERDNITVWLMAFAGPKPVNLVSHQMVEPGEITVATTRLASYLRPGRLVAVIAVLALAIVVIIGLGNRGGKAETAVSVAAITLTTPQPSLDAFVAAPADLQSPTKEPTARLATPAPSDPRSIALNPLSTVATTVVAPAITLAPSLTPLPTATQEPRVPTEELPTATPTPTFTPTQLPTRTPTPTNTATPAAPQFRAINLKPNEDLVINRRRELHFQLDPPPRNDEQFLIVGWEAQNVGPNLFICPQPVPQALRAISNAASVAASGSEASVFVSDQDLRARGLLENTKYCWGVSHATDPLELISIARDDLKLRIEPNRGSNPSNAGGQPPPPGTTTDDRGLNPQDSGE
jgi:PPM family protein phosphatase